MKNKIAIWLACGYLGLCIPQLAAHEIIVPVQLKGVVLDETGNPLPGVQIKSEKDGDEFLTDQNGAYNIELKDGSKYLTVSYVGFVNRKISVERAAREKNIVLQGSSEILDEKIDLGYLTVFRRALTGAVSTVSGEVLDKSPESNLGKTFAGRFSGMITMEKDAELGQGTKSSTSNAITLLVRGLSTINGVKPLILIDGVISPNVNYVYITPDEIESVTVLKDASTTAIYGIQGANGVISIKTKRGLVGKAKVNVSFDQSLQQTTRKPLFVNAANYTRMRNEAGVNDGLGSYSQFTKEQMEHYERGDNVAYPDNNWYDQFIRPVTWMTRAGVSVRGGNERVCYYSNINYMHQSLPFKTADEATTKYDPTPKNDRFNFRSNIDVKINDYLSGFMRLSGNINLNKTTGYANADIYNHIFNLPPTMYGPLTPSIDADGNLLENGGQVVTHDSEKTPVYGMLNRSGYIKNLVTNINAQAGLTADLGMLVKGLSVTGLMAYQTNSANQTKTTQDSERYVMNGDPTDLNFILKGTNTNSALQYAKNSTSYYNLNLYANANYNHMFGAHSISALAYIFYQQLETESLQGAQMLPYKRRSIGGSATYGYKERYFVKADLGYSGSEQFHPNHRYMVTPSISVSWIVSDEKFLKHLRWLDLLKLRISYGVTANDQLGNARMLYEDYMDVKGNEGLKGNPLLSAEKMKKQNYGFDLGFFKGLTVSFDWYKSICDNMLVSSGELVPEYQGIALENYPKLNKGRMENQGFELSAMYSKLLNKHWSFYLGGAFSYNKNKVIDVMEAENVGYTYPYKTQGYSRGQYWGYIIDYSNGNGMFNFRDELEKSGLSYAFGTPRVGDFIYKDLNGDKVIDEKDKAPVGYSKYPRQYYNLSGGLRFKNWELNFMFQGAGKVTTVIEGVGAYESAYQGVFNDIHLNAWTEERWNNGETITYPALSLKESTNHQPNSFFIMDASYLRLKNAEIAYTLPVHISQKVMAQRIRISLSGQNLFTIDNMRSKYIDPEIANLGTFQQYRVFNFGVNLTF